MRPLLLRDKVFALAVLGLASCTTKDRAPTPPPQQPAATQTAPVAPRHASKMPDEASNKAPPQAQAAKPEPPPYDLAADRDKRIQKAKDELGPKVRSAIVSDIFVVIGPPGWQGPQFDESVALMRSSMAGYMNNRFTKKPAEAISVYLFPTAQPYEGFCKTKYSAPCIAHFGFYQPADRYMVMNIGLGLGTLTHEIVHPLVEADFPHAPTWINEGIASVFEQPILGKPGEIHGGKNWRLPRLRQALTTREKDKARLDVLFGMPDETFRGEVEDLHYAQARYVCQWLDEKGKLWPFYQKWRDNFATDPTGEKSFEEVVGMKPAEANAAWAKWALTI
jgi:hypothetical protein